MKKNYLSLAIGLSLASFSVHAQQPAANEKSAVGAENKIDGVTITARRNSESIQETPVAVSVFGSEDLRDIQASKIDGIQGAVPNLNIVQGAGSSNTVNAYIRGIGQPDALQSFDPGVGIYIDEVYYPRVQGALFSMFDVQQVEVLRGPQGTYYGKNTTGGAIKITTMNPFEDEDRRVELSVGNLGLAEARAYFSGKFSDTVAGSLSAGWLTHDGYVTDPATGKDYNDQNIKTIRGKLAFKPSDTFSAVVSLDYTKQDEALTLGQPMGGLYSYDLGDAIFDDPINFNPYTQLVAPPTGEYDFKSRTSFTGDEGQKLTQQGIAVTMKWDFTPEWQLHSITGYRKLKVDSYVDMDGSEYQLADIFLSIDQKQLSQEINLHYDNGRNFNAVFGLYYMDEQVPSSQVSNSDDFLKFFDLPVSFLRTSEDDLDNKSMAFFATGNWQFKDGWEVSAGLRYSKDSKDYSRTTSYYSDILGVSDPDVAFSVSDDWSAWTPTASIQKAFSKNSMGYFSATRGFKSGGFNGRSTVIPETYRPEYVWSYEAGLKLQSEDGFFSGR
ncbi:TonB-dependent receptor, partial [Arenimonas sp. GDDSR-1]|uniref:TonB-dependent receptor n=1 Tax=Arenimonas sp. GDDSR-1 TaxID=2950125 RepID=UPI00262FC37E